MENEKQINEKEIKRISRRAKYLSKRLFGIRFYNGKEIKRVFKKQILPLLGKEDVNYSISFITGEQGLMTLINLGIENGFSFRRYQEGERYKIMPELARLINNRYNGYKYFLKHAIEYSGNDLERIDERNYSTGLNEIQILIYKSHLDTALESKDIIIRFIDYLDYDTLL